MREHIHLLLSILLLILILPIKGWTDGTETLGPPVGISLASGSGIVGAGTGLVTQPGFIDIFVPAGITVNQVLLYWSGVSENTDLGDPDIRVNSIDVTGQLIGGPSGNTSFRTNSYRADITGLGLIGSGANALTVDGLDFPGGTPWGAGVLVIFDDGSTIASIDLRDGLDIAFQPAPTPFDTTVLQTFNFAPADVDRLATFPMFFSSVSGSVSGDFRPSAIEITVGGDTTVFDNLLDSNNGSEWDTLNLTVQIPAFATSLTAKALSVDNLDTGFQPASFDWIVSGLAISAFCGDGIPFNTPGEECDDGNKIDGDGCSATCFEEEECPDDEHRPTWPPRDTVQRDCSRVSDLNDPGSILVYPLIDNINYTTIINIANTGSSAAVLECYAVTLRNDECVDQKIDFRIKMTPDEKFWWNTATGITKENIKGQLTKVPALAKRKGYLFCFAVNDDRMEMANNVFKGDATLFDGTRAFNYNAIPSQALRDTTQDRKLMLDGDEYTMATSQIMFEGFAENAFGAIKGKLAVTNIGFDLIKSKQPSFNINVFCWNEDEVPLSTHIHYQDFEHYSLTDMSITRFNIGTDAFQCATTSTHAMWAVTYGTAGGMAYGGNVFQKPETCVGTSVILPKIPL